MFSLSWPQDKVNDNTADYQFVQELSNVFSWGGACAINTLSIST